MVRPTLTRTVRPPLPPWLERSAGRVLAPLGGVGRRLHGALRVAFAAAGRFSGANGMSRGGAVAFYSAFSVAPLLVLVTGIMVWVLGDDGARASIMESLSRLIGEREASMLDTMMQSRGLSTQGDTLRSVLALATTAVGATAVFAELRAAVQAMWGEHSPPSGVWTLVKVRLLALGVVVGCGFLLSVAMVVQAATLVGLQWLARTWPILTPILTVAESVWSCAVIALIFAIVLRWLPDRRVPWRPALIGAATAAVLFMIGRWAISLYVAQTATQSAMGAASSFAALLVWVYWSSQIFLLGAAVAMEMAPLPDTLPTRAEESEAAAARARDEGQASTQGDAADPATSTRSQTSAGDPTSPRPGSS